MDKLKSCRGETLVESLCAILVITVVFVFLCGAIVSAARSNAQLRDMNQDFSYDSMTVADSSFTIRVVGTATDNTYPVKEYATDTSSAEGNYDPQVFHRYEMQEAGN